jgi:hypothetical protein
MRRLQLPWIITLPVLAACGPTYTQNQAALVPHAEPVAYDGQPLTAPAALWLGAGNVTDLVAPRAAAPNVGDSVPRTQLRGAYGYSFGNLTLEGFYERGLVSTETPLSTTQPPVHNGSVTGFGLGTTYSFAMSPQMRFGFVAEIASWSVPWVQYSQCVSGCPNPGVAIETSGTADQVMTYTFGLVPSYRTGPWTLFGGLTLRNQPTTYQKQEIQGGDPGTFVDEGDFNATLSLGVEFNAAGVLIALMLHDTVTADPIQYGPGIAAMVTVPLRPRSRAPRSLAPPSQTPTSSAVP